MKKDISNYLLFVKFALFAFIILSPVIDFKGMNILNNIVVKIVLLLVIVLMCFVDFQLALIGTIAFLILVINLNNNILKKMQNIDKFGEKESRSLSPLDSQFLPPLNIPKDIDQSHNIICQNPNKNNINNDMLTHFIDDKIKPYEVFIKMMTNENALEKAQGLEV